MKSGLQIINPLKFPDWDKLLLRNENYSFFHSSSWAKVLYESYNYKPLYFTVIVGDKLSILIPVMEISSFLTGKRGVALPFTDYCQIIFPDIRHFPEKINDLIKYAKNAGWKHIEWRGGEIHLKDMTPSSSYYLHTLDLIPNEQEVFSKFRNSTRRNITKAIKEGVRVHLSNSLESVRQFYRLNCITRKRHGLPPQPYHFFQKIYEHVISNKMGFVVIASCFKREIAGAVYFHFGKKGIYKYGASDRNYQQLRANNLVMWEAIRWYAKNGFKSLSLGRTESENQGLLQFKRGWGANEKIINYYKYNFGKESFINERSKITGIHNKLFNITPMPLLKFVGSVLYRHIG